MASFLNKIRLLLWKNWVLRKRHPVVSVCEVLIPVLLFFLIAYTRSKIHILGKHYDNSSSFIEPIYETDFYYNRFPMTDAQLLFTPKTQFTVDLMRKVQLKFQLPNSALLGLNTESDLIAYYETKAKNYTVLAVIFKLTQPNVPPKFLNYEIRPHEETVMWNTDQLFMNSPVYIPHYGSASYINNGFMALQLAIDRSFVEMLTDKNIPDIYMQEFPFPPHLDDMGISDVFNYVLPIVTVFGFVTLCLSVLKRVVEEKRTGIKELLKILGLKPWMHWTGWFIHAFVPSFISVCLIVIFMKVKLWDSPYPPIEYCNFSVLFMFLLLYCISGIIFSFAFSTLFSSPTIAIISGILVWLLPYFTLKSIVSKYPLMKWHFKIILSLFPNMALEFGFKAISVYESREIGLQWNNIQKSGAEGADDMTMLNVFIMFIIEAILYMLLTLYIDNINPGPYGIAKPYNYPFSKLKKFVRCFKPDVKIENDNKLIDDDVTENVEPADFLKPGIKIRNLKKNYGNKKALCGLSMDIYEDQITALLGHNGAGKTTTLSILTGMIQSTSGDIEVNDIVIGPNSGKKGIDKIRCSLGLCPQENIHFMDLTVFEHLVFFGRLKGSTSKEAHKEARDLLERLNLHNKRNSLPSSLSGGMKRKLSLGMTLVGKSKILILDEPTSGLDPEARREIWDILLGFRGSRTILISTHFMEEADVLGDRIAIMDNGRLECYGTSMYLKNLYGTGYHLKVIVNTEEEDNMLENRKLFEAIENIVKKCIPQAKAEQCRGNSCTYLLPVESKSEYSKLLGEMEEHKETFSISNINLTYTTLEEVFLRVDSIATKNKNDSKSDTNSVTSVNSAYSENSKKKGYPLFCQQFFTLLKKKYLVSKKMKNMIILQIFLSLLLTLITVYFSTNSTDQFVEKEPSLLLDLSLYGKTFVFYNNPPSSSVLSNFTHHYDQVVSTQKGIPLQVEHVSQAIINKGIENIVSYKEHLVVAAEFNETEDGKSVINAMYSNNAVHGAPISMNLLMNAVVKGLVGPDYSISTKIDPLPAAVTKESLNQQSAVEVATLWMFIFPLGLLFAVSGFLLFPQMENKSNSKQLQLMCGIRPFNYWFATYLFDLLFYVFLTLLQIACVGIIYGSLTAAGTLPFIGKNEIGALLTIIITYGICGIPYSYLFSYNKSAASAFAAFIISSLFLGTTLTVIVLILELSGDAYYENIGEILRHIFPLLPQVGLTYTAVRFAVKTVSNNNWMMKSADQKNAKCRFDFNPCCNGDNTPECGAYQSYFYAPKDGIGNDLVVMISSTVVFLFVLAVVETHLFKNLRDLLIFKLTRGYTSDKPDVPMDEEVKEEENKVYETLKRVKTFREKDAVDKVDAAPEVLLVENLQKTFGNKKVVKGVSFRVDKRSCFGLLGVNGAGKTTTFRMLTGNEPCTGGNARIYDNLYNSLFSINDKEYLQRVGYCPQFDAINELLPGRTILELFANLRGISGDECKKEVDFWINALGLKYWADQPCGNYSGGNKRKLSMAIALIGNQPVTMLDEPTSGVDPVSRRKLWDVLSDIQTRDTKNSNPIVLTSHSMEECEVLCNKLAIMKDGQIRCIGTIPHLKKKYGQGFTVYLKLKPVLTIVTQRDSDKDQLLPSTESQEDERVRKLKEDFKGLFSRNKCELKDEHSGLLHYHISDCSLSWSKLFKQIDDLKQKHSIIEDYNISETTLEEVFLSIARSEN